jgi:hypothetical protein
LPGKIVFKYSISESVNLNDAIEEIDNSSLAKNSLTA